MYVGLCIIQNRHTGEQEDPENVFLNTPSFLHFRLFWDITQLIVVIPNRRFGTTYRSCLQRWRSSRRNPFFFLDFLTLEMGPISCLGTSVRNYRYKLRNIPGNHKLSHLYMCILFSNHAVNKQTQVYLSTEGVSRFQFSKNTIPHSALRFSSVQKANNVRQEWRWPLAALPNRPTTDRP